MCDNNSRGMCSVRKPAYYESTFIYYTVPERVCKVVTSFFIKVKLNKLFSNKLLIEARNC